MTAEETPTVAQAWSRVMADVQAVGKTGRNTQQNYNFRGIDAVVNAAGPAMREHGVIVVPTVLDAHYRDIEVGKNRTLMREVTVKVRYSIIGPAGDVLSANVPDFGTVYGESMDSGDKGTAKAMSVAYRIFLLQALTIPTDEPDADESSYERASRVEAEPAVSKDKLAQITAAVDALSVEDVARLKGWVNEQHMPAHPKFLTDAQADRVLAYLAEHDVETEQAEAAS